MHRTWKRLLCDGMLFAAPRHRRASGPAANLGTEPELLTPQLTVDAPRIIYLLRSFFLGRFAGYELPTGLSHEEAADYVARMVLSFIASPGRWDLSDPVQVRELVRSEILAGLMT